MRVNAAGNANGLAARLGMPGSYRPQAGGDLQFEMTTQSNGVAALSGAVMLAGDKLTAAGAPRPSADGPRFEGTLEAGLADALLLLSGSAWRSRCRCRWGAVNCDDTWPSALPVWRPGLGRGQVTGEGVLQLDGLSNRSSMPASSCVVSISAGLCRSSAKPATAGADALGSDGTRQC